MVVCEIAGAVQLSGAAMELQSLEPPELDKEEQELTYPGPSWGVSIVMGLPQ